MNGTVSAHVTRGMGASWHVELCEQWRVFDVAAFIIIVLSLLRRHPHGTEVGRAACSSTGRMTLCMRLCFCHLPSTQVTPIPGVHERAHWVIEKPWSRRTRAPPDRPWTPAPAEPTYSPRST